MSARKTTTKKTARKAARRSRELAPQGAIASRDFAPKDLTGAPDFLKDAWEGLKKITVDLATVDVTTFQGDVTVKADSKGKFNPSAFFDSLQGEIVNGSTLTLVAHTHVDFDLDSVVITKPDADTKLMDAHNKAVQTAVDARMSVVRFLKELF